MRYIKYIILGLTIILSYLTGLLAFTIVCPVGGLTATLPTLAIDGSSYILDDFFWHKMAFLIATLIMIAVIRRGFCKYLCPFGALIAVFNKVSIVRLNFNKEKCNDCNVCLTVCPMGIDPRKSRQLECIMCFKCVGVCNQDALSKSFH